MELLKDHGMYLIEFPRVMLAAEDSLCLGWLKCSSCGEAEVSVSADAEDAAPRRRPDPESAGPTVGGTLGVPRQVASTCSQLSRGD